MEKKRLTAKGWVLAILTPLVLLIFGMVAISGKESVAPLFSGYLKFFWIAVLLGLGVFSTRIR
ncbi:MAG: hypothetical protein JW971_10880 [Synergistales bacterium]|nr:hypothetical protein [Synergistales bacterium]